jgi:aminopeptidase N
MDASFEETDEVLAFFSELTGLPYPYPKYSQAAVANFPWGGMENISATTLTPLTFTDERGQRDGTSHALVAHEAAHQWFGDLLTCEDWSHVWLNEGFATYLTELYFEETRGADEFRARMRDAQDRYLAAAVGPARRATVSDVYREPEDLFDAVVYEGAASRLHLLRFVLGDEPFRAGVRRYLAQNAGRSVVTGDLIGAFEEETGEELDGFFDQWFFSRGHPEFEVEWSWDGRAGLVHLDVRQTQDTEDGTPAVFRTPVLVEVREDSGSALHRLEIDERAERFVLPAPSEPLYVRFDVNGWIPKTVTWKRSPGEWIAIAAADADVNGRRDAVRALGELAGAARDTRPAEHERCGAALAERLRGDGSEWVRAGAATAAGRAGGEETRARLEHAAQADPAARVRVAALEALRAWGADPGLAELGRRVFDQGYSWATMGAAAGLVCAADPRSAFDWIRARLPRSSPHDRLRAHLLEHLAGLPEAGVQAELLRWAQDATTDPTARAAAVRGLARPGRNLVAVVRALSGLLDERSFRLRQAVVLALAELGDPRARGALAEYYPRSASSSERRAIEAALTRAGG